MMIQRVEMCISLVKLAFEFVVVVAEAVGTVIHENSSNSHHSIHEYSPFIPFVGFLP
ncbi:uncharacterized protein [Euphorbia lathyris]|uniref:uncharacterized protein n=1 Tax=Euphorbia lathyris TaxID=212925 RepID=UPI003314457D